MQFQGQTVLIGVDDMDVFKGIELKLQAVERVLDHHPEWRGRLVLLQVTNAPRCAPPLEALHVPYMHSPAGTAAWCCCRSPTRCCGAPKLYHLLADSCSQWEGAWQIFSEVHTWCQYIVRPAWGTCISSQCARKCLHIVANGTESWRLSCCSAWMSFWLCLLFQIEDELRAGHRSTGKDIAELHDYCAELVAQINAKYATPSYTPVVWLERPVRGPPRAPGVGCRVRDVQHQLQTAKESLPYFCIRAWGLRRARLPCSLRKAHLSCLNAMVV